METRLEYPDKEGLSGGRNDISVLELLIFLNKYYRPVKDEHGLGKVFTSMDEIQRALSTPCNKPEIRAMLKRLVKTVQICTFTGKGNQDFTPLLLQVQETNSYVTILVDVDTLERFANVAIDSINFRKLIKEEKHSQPRRKPNGS